VTIRLSGLPGDRPAGLPVRPTPLLEVCHADHTVIPFPTRRAGAAGYSDTAALNDIHAILCRRGGGDPATVGDLARVVARGGRPVVDVRDIDATVEHTPAGLPQARVDAGGTSIEVYQDHSGGLAVTITATPADETGLTVTLNGRPLHAAAGSTP
jgi:hypothetical protein